MLYEDWVRYLKIMRHRRRWTQGDLAIRLGISRSQYSAIESGRSVVSYKHLYNLGKVFDIPLGDLLAMSHLELTPDEKKLFSKATSPIIKMKGQSSKRRRSAKGQGVLSQEHDPPNGSTQTSNRTADRVSKQERGRPKGSRIIICMCERRIYGRPGTPVQCSYCGASTMMPKD